MRMDEPLKDVKSYLSENVYHILVELADKIESNAKTQYVTKDLTFDWCEIQLMFEDLEDDFNILEQSESWYYEKLKQIWLVLHNAKKAFLVVEDNDSELQRLWALCKLTGYEEEVKECFDTFKKNRKVGAVHVTLKLTAMLERLLGNIFLIKGKSVPFLLRDLLNTRELQNILGRIPVAFMQLLFGSPKGLNIRNVIWHGFIFPEELHPSLVYSLFLLFPSIGRLLQTQVIPMRPQLTNFDKYAGLLDNVFSEDLDVHKLVSKIWRDTKYISPQHYTLWEASLQLYNEKKYGDCLVLLLPQFEHLLRSVYCDVNKCPQRLLTAESTVLYTTLDEILFHHLSEPDGSNKVMFVLGEGLLLMLEDILSVITGPRLRDKLSHGECSLNNIPRTLAKHMFCITVCICIKANNFSQIDVNKAMDFSQKLKHDFSSTGQNQNNGNETFHNMLIDTCEKYESKFHIGILLHRSLFDVINKVGSLSNLSVPADMVLDKLKIESSVLKMKTYIFSCVNLSPSEFVDVLHKKCSQIKLKTLNRPKHETELIVLFSNIVKNISLTVSKITEGNIEKFNQWQTRKLRSRGRQTYKRMHQAVCTLQCALLCMLAIVIAFLKILNESNSEHGQNYLRFAKKMLKTVENTASFCDFEKTDGMNLVN